MCHQIASFLLKNLKNLANIKICKIEIAKMWKTKTKTIPVIVWVLGMIKKGTQKHANEIQGNFSLAEIDKIVLESTTHILRRTRFTLNERICFFLVLFSLFCFFNTHYFTPKL